MINPYHFQPLHTLVPSCKHTTCNTARVPESCQSQTLCVCVCVCAQGNCARVCVQSSSSLASVFTVVCALMPVHIVQGRQVVIRLLDRCVHLSTTATGSKHNHISLFLGLHECFPACDDIPWQTHATPRRTVGFWCCEINHHLPGLAMIHWAVFQHNTPSKRWHIKPRGQKYVQLFPSNKVFLCANGRFSGGSFGAALCKECNPSIRYIKSPHLVFF